MSSETGTPGAADGGSAEEFFTAIARKCHEANRAYCQSIGDDSQAPFDDAPAWQRTSARNGVMGIACGEIVGPEDSHVSWTAEKIATGWTYGPVKDPVAKTHPCLVPYDQLPEEQKAKDAIFFETACTALEEKGWTRSVARQDNGVAVTQDADGKEIGQ